MAEGSPAERPNGLTPHLPVLQQRVRLRQRPRAQAVVLVGGLHQTPLVIGTHLKHTLTGRRLERDSETERHTHTHK